MKVRMSRTTADIFDDGSDPVCTVGRAAGMLGTTQGFLRSLDEAKLTVHSAPRA